MAKKPKRTSSSSKSQRAAPKAAATAITPKEYNGLQAAFDHFNQELYGGKLQDLMIVLQRRAHSYGHFAPDRFAVRADHHLKQHELSLNPDQFYGQSDKEVCQTLVHEMTHLQQHMHGTPSKSGYHNKEWAAMLKAAGLYPSNTGKPGGKETGSQMMDYIIPDGPFEQSFARLEAKGWKLNLQSAPRPGTQNNTPNNSKTKYTCPKCGFNAWCKPDGEPACKTCGYTDMVAAKAA